MHSTADFRNGKYEGEMNSLGQRHGLGIFIDDDLTFYISHWRNNRINGLSLIYISHGKYIYGEWKDNEPHGLTIFRSGDTVLVGKCELGRPTGKCLVIFQKFNFACVLQEGNEEWGIVASGQLASYETLMQYISLMGTPVPDHFFSLTKFACHFSKHSPLVKTLPCLNACCYFGYNNGLALVFNSANGLVSVGAHRSEELGEFGGRFQGVRWAEEGSFEDGGERVRYSGQRPTSKIYNIFQKIHKRSLEFHNEYFDSKVKCFTSIEELLRSQLENIANECRRDRQLRHIDLSESLDYQDYTEEQSLKLNSIRDNIYQPPPPQKNQQDRSKSPRYFRKPEKTPSVTTRELYQSSFSDLSKQKEETKKEEPKQKEEIKTPKSTFKSKEPNHQPSSYNMIKRSPLKETSEFIPETRKKSSIAPSDINHKEEALKQSQQSTTPSKLKEKMKSNNLRYIITQPQPQEEKKEKPPILAKTNNIYKQIKNRKEEAQLPKDSPTNSIESEPFRVPNFKCSDTPKEKQQTLPQTPTKQSYQKSIYVPHISSKYEQEQSQRETSLTPRKNTDISTLCKPNYQDIEERRKRILRQYRDLNHPETKLPQQTKPNHLKMESPASNMVFSLSKEEQSSFGYMPITITDKYSQNRQQRQTQIKESKQDQIVRPFRKEGLQEVSNFQYPIGKDLKAQKSTYQKSAEFSKHDENKSQIKIANGSVSSSVSSTTPARVKKNYQYLYE